MRKSLCRSKRHPHKDNQIRAWGWGGHIFLYVLTIQLKVLEGGWTVRSKAMISKLIVTQIIDKDLKTMMGISK